MNTFRGDSISRDHIIGGNHSPNRDHKIVSSQDYLKVSEKPLKPGADVSPHSPSHQEYTTLGACCSCLTSAAVAVGEVAVTAGKVAVYTAVVPVVAAAVVAPVIALAVASFQA